MTVYGTDTRAATDTGTPQVGVPTTRSGVATQVQQSQKQPDAMDAFVEQNSIGNALVGFLEEGAKETQANNKLRGAAQVGNAKGLTAIQKATENVGWEKFIYGKDATHQGMQEQVIANRLRGNYNTNLSKVSESANLKPEDYYAKLEKQNSKILEEYVDDPSTRGLVQQQLTKETEKLLTAQTKEHYGWKQQEGKRGFEEAVQQSLDGFSLEKNTLITEEEMSTLAKELISTVNGSSKPVNMTKEAARTSTLNVIMANMRAGNAGAMLLAQHAGLDKKLSVGEQVKWDAAMRNYDTEFKHNIDVINSNAEAQIISAQQPNQIDAAAQQQISDLEEMYQRSSGSAYARKVIAGADVDVQKNYSKQRAMQARLDKDKAKVRGEADKAKAKLEAARLEAEAINDYHAANDGGVKAHLQREHGFTTKQREQGFDTFLLKGVTPFMKSGQLPTIPEFASELRTSPKLQQHIKTMLTKHKTTSPMLSTIMNTVVNSTDNLYDEDGKVLPAGLETVAMMETLSASDKFVNMIGGKEAAREWQLRARNIRSGQGKAATDKQIDSWRNNKSKQDAAGFSWKQVLPEDTNRRDWMASKLRKLGITNPTSAQITDNLQDYKDDMVAFSSKGEADNAFFQRMKNNTTTVGGHKLHGSAYLDEVTQWSADDLLGQMEKYNLMVGKLDILAPKQGVKSLSQLPNARVYTKEGFSGLFISSPSAAQEVFISTEEMEEAEQMILEQQNLAKLAAKRQAKAEAYTKEARQSASGGLYIKEELN